MDRRPKSMLLCFLISIIRDLGLMKNLLWNETMELFINNLCFRSDSQSDSQSYNHHKIFYIWRSAYKPVFQNWEKPVLCDSTQITCGLAKKEKGMEEREDQDGVHSTPCSSVVKRNMALSIVSYLYWSSIISDFHPREFTFTLFSLSAIQLHFCCLSHSFFQFVLTFCN